MPPPDNFDVAAFLGRLDERQELRGTRVIFFDGFRMTVLREGPLYCAPGLKTVVVRVAPEEVALQSPVAAHQRDSRFYAELLGGAISCSAAVIGWAVVLGGTGAAPLSGGGSLLISGLVYGAATASSVQCGNSLVRIGSEAFAPEVNEWLDSQAWYDSTMLALDAVSMAGAVTAGAVTIKMMLAVKRGTGRSMLAALKGLSRQQRRRLAEELIRAQNPGISNRALKSLVRMGMYPKRYTGMQVTKGIRNQLLDAAGAALSFTGSASGGVVRKLAIGVAQSFETY